MWRWTWSRLWRFKRKKGNWVRLEQAELEKVTFHMEGLKDWLGTGHSHWLELRALRRREGWSRVKLSTPPIAVQEHLLPSTRPRHLLRRPNLKLYFGVFDWGEHLQPGSALTPRCRHCTGCGRMISSLLDQRWSSEHWSKWRKPHWPRRHPSGYRKISMYMRMWIELMGECVHRDGTIGVLWLFIECGRNYICALIILIKWLLAFLNQCGFHSLQENPSFIWIYNIRYNQFQTQRVWNESYPFL